MSPLVVRCGVAATRTREPAYWGESRTLWRPWQADAAVAVVLFSALLAADLDGRGATGAGPVTATLRLLGLLVAAAAVVGRRSRPEAAFLTGTLGAAVCTSLGGPAPVAVCVAFAAWSAAVTGSRAPRLLRPAAACATIAVGVAVGQAPSWPEALLASAAVVAAGWLAGEGTRERRTRVLALVERRAEAERRHAAAVRQAATDERLVIARELHDVVAHAMSVIAVRAGVARMVMDSDPQQVRETLEIVETTTRRALAEMRLLVSVLRGTGEVAADLQPAPGLAVLTGLLTQVALAGVRVSVDERGQVRPLPEAVDLSAYRIVQEALTNVVRHAGPTTATVRLEYLPDRVVVDVRDEGPLPRHRVPARPSTGQRLAQPPGHGLIGMAERVALFGGDLEAGPVGSGFAVRATLRTDARQP